MLNWNRKILSAPWLGGGSYTEVVADMLLELHQLKNGVPVLIDSSNSPVDNLEHLYLRGITAGNYTITVTTDIAVDYDIAWRAGRGKLPNITLTSTAPGFSFNDVIPGKEFILEKSSNLSSWEPYHTFTPATTSETFIDPAGIIGERTFYRLAWDPVN